MSELVDTYFDARIKPGMFPGNLELDVLMERVLKADDYGAFEQLFTRLYTNLCAHSIKFVRSREVAEELVNDVFFAIWKDRNQLEIRAAKSYIFTSVRNRSIDYVRRVRQSLFCDLEYATNIPANYANSHDLMLQDELLLQIKNSIELLPKQCKLIFEMSRENGMKYKEIAAKLKISIKTVETQMGRALKHLRETLQ